MGLSYLSPYWSWANSGELVFCRGISIGPVPPHEPLKLVWCAVSGPTQLGTELDSGGELSYLEDVKKSILKFAVNSALKKSLQDSL
jgi:hypothetical protein